MSAAPPTMDTLPSVGSWREGCGWYGLLTPEQRAIIGGKTLTHGQRIAMPVSILVVDRQDEDVDGALFAAGVEPWQIGSSRFITLMWGQR